MARADTRAGAVVCSFCHKSEPAVSNVERWIRRESLGLAAASELDEVRGLASEMMKLE